MMRIFVYIVLLLLTSSRAYAIEMIGFGATTACGEGTTILGTDTVYSNTFNGGNFDTVYAYSWTASATGLICTGEAYFTEAVTENVKMLVYNASTHALIATSTPITSTTANAWNVFTFDGTVQITSGQSYFIGWVHSPTSYEPGIRHNGGAWLLQRDTTGTYSSPPTDLSGHDSVSDTMGIPSLRIKN